jgi:hypothetical protein
MPMDHDWTFEAVRVCRACGGTGKPSLRPPMPGSPPSDIPLPVACLTCHGTTQERRRFSTAELKDLLAL